jgi:hypothetical protein
MKDVSDQADAARNALSDMREGLDSAKRLVERTRSLLRGETPYDENEQRMSEQGGSSLAGSA